MKETPSQVVIKDFSIQVRTLDRTVKDLARWKLAMQSAENVFNPQRKLLYELYEDVVIDEHLTSVMDQRRLSLTNASLVFQKEGEEVEMVQAIVNTLAFERLLEWIVDSKFYGYSLIYADFANSNGPAIDLVPRMHVVPERGIVVSQPGNQTGICYLEPPYTNLYFGVGRPKDLGLLLKAAPLTILKKNNVSDWAAFNEVFGQPLRKATYSPGDPTQKAQLEQALANMGSMNYVVVPEGSNLEIVGTNQSTASDTYNKLTNHFDQAISKLIVGQTMTTESGSSLSQSEVHERVSNKIGQADRRYVLKVLESVVKPMLIAQGIPADGNFQFIEEEEDVSKKDRLSGDIQIHKTVGKLTKEYWASEYNVTFVDMDDTTEEPVDDPKEKPVDEPTNEPDESADDPQEKPGDKQNNAAETTASLKERTRALLLKLFGIDPF